MTSALNKYVFSCLPASERHNEKPKDKPKDKQNLVKGLKATLESPTGALRLQADTQVKLIEKHEQDIKDKPPNEQISGFDIPDKANADAGGAGAGADALYEKINTYEFPMERYYLNAKDARRRETLANTCRLSNQKITSALNGLIRGRVRP